MLIMLPPHENLYRSMTIGKNLLVKGGCRLAYLKQRCNPLAFRKQR
eukprot:COSAG02_NODE_15530_length_1162_cov_9633.359360_1_plen_45_part_10